MGNCLITKFNGALQGGDILYLGYVHIHVCMLDESSAESLYFINLSTGGLSTSPVGSFLTGGKTFVNGKTKIEQGDVMQFAPNDTYELYVPKYSFPLIAPSVNGSDEYGRCSYNVDDYEYNPSAQVQLDNSWVDTLNYCMTKNSQRCEGSLENVFSWMNPKCITNIKLNNSRVSIVITDSLIKKFYKLQYLYLVNNPNITGNLKDFVSQYMQLNKSDVKARTDTLTIRFEGSPVAPDIFDVSGSDPKSIHIQFSGTEIITINVLSSTIIVKSFNYNIDTDIFVEQ